MSFLLSYGSIVILIKAFMYLLRRHNFIKTWDKRMLYLYNTRNLPMSAGGATAAAGRLTANEFNAESAKFMSEGDKYYY